MKMVPNVELINYGPPDFYRNRSISAPLTLLSAYKADDELEAGPPDPEPGQISLETNWC
jgi:hypothetical protein